jgi:hypothetical protein
MWLGKEETTWSETPARQSEVEKGLSGMGDKIKAGAKAMGSKIGDSSKGLGTEYEKNKTDEELKD